MKPTQATVLLHIAENTYADGDDLISEWRRHQSIMIEHARRILEDEALIEKARELNQQDKERFASYIPRQQERSAAVQHQERTRAALTQIKKVESDGNQQRSTPDRQAQTGG